VGIMFDNPILLFALVQLAAFAAVLFRLGARASIAYLASVVTTWSLVLVLVSGHIVVAAHALWVIPALWLVAVVAKSMRHKRVEA
jgi:hypothetical protein